MNDQLDITYVPLDQLEEWPGNARVGDVERIKASMRQHGVFNPVIVQRSTNRVMIGNHRLAALRELLPVGRARRKYLADCGPLPQRQ